MLIILPGFDVVTLAHLLSYGVELLATRVVSHSVGGIVRTLVRLVNPEASDGREQNYHLSDISNVARFISVYEGTVLLPDIFELDPVLRVVFSSVIEYELLVVPVDGS